MIEQMESISTYIFSTGFPTFFKNVKFSKFYKNVSFFSPRCPPTQTLPLLPQYHSGFTRFTQTKKMNANFYTAN